MRWDDDARRLRNALARTGTHVRRAVGALGRLGPGTHPGMIAEVERLEGDLVVTGHVHVAGERCTSVVLTVDGVAVDAIPLDPPDPDAAIPHRVLWTARIPVDRLPPGPVSIGAQALGTSGLVDVLQPLTWVPADAPEALPAPPTPWSEIPIGRLDTPEEGETQTGGVVEVSGWAASVVALDRIEVTLGDEPVERAGPFCDGRADVVEHTGDPRDLLAGFRHAVEIGHLAEGTVTRLQVAAVGAAGRSLIGTRQVTVGPLERPLDATDRRWLAALTERTRVIAETRVSRSGTGLVVFTHDLGLGGAQLWLQEILRAVLGDPDVSCTVVSQHDGHFRRELEDAGVPVHICGPFPSSAGAYESRVRDLVELVVSERSNVVLANTAIAFLGVDVALRCGIPAIYAIHDHFSENRLWHGAFGGSVLDPYLRERRAAALQEASVLAFVADATRRLYLPDGGDHRAMTHRYGIPLDEVARTRATLDRRQQREAHGFRPGDQVLINVARVEPRKAQATLVLAFARIAGTHPGTHLVLVGADGGHYSRTVTQLIHSLGLEDRVRMVPVTSQVAPWFVMADGFVLPSDSESLPRTIIEAMAYELPVLATDVGGVAEIVRDGETGLLVGTRDVGELTAGLRRLLALDDDQRRALTDRAVAEVRADRDVAGYTGSFGRLIRGLAKNPEATPAELLAGE
jgi:D-inositol-3-phosphate glycosyltransferase